MSDRASTLPHRRLAPISSSSSTDANESTSIERAQHELSPEVASPSRPYRTRFKKVPISDVSPIFDVLASSGGRDRGGELAMRPIRVITLAAIAAMLLSTIPTAAGAAPRESTGRPDANPAIEIEVVSSPPE